MPCRVETHPVHGLTVVRVDGEVDADEIFSAIREVWAAPAYRRRPCVLWDFRNAGVSRMQSADVRQVVHLEREGRPDLPPVRMAVLVSTDVGYGMARMLGALIEREPIDLRIFRDDEKAAWRWLGDPEASDLA